MPGSESQQRALRADGLVDGLLIFDPGGKKLVVLAGQEVHQLGGECGVGVAVRLADRASRPRISSRTHGDHCRGQRVEDAQHNCVRRRADPARAHRRTGVRRGPRQSVLRRDARIPTRCRPQRRRRVPRGAADPTGSACSITIGVNVGAGEPGTTKGLHLIVDDIEAAPAHLRAGGVEKQRRPALRGRTGGSRAGARGSRLRVVHLLQ